MKHLWKRLIASMLTTVMLVSVLPPTALAALADNTPDQNEAILRELTEFWGDEKTAQEAMESLRKYHPHSQRGTRIEDPHLAGGQGADKTQNGGRRRSEYERLCPQDGTGRNLHQAGFAGCAPACFYAPAVHE